MLQGSGTTISAAVFFREQSHNPIAGARGHRRQRASHPIRHSGDEGHGAAIGNALDGPTPMMLEAKSAAEIFPSLAPKVPISVA